MRIKFMAFLTSLFLGACTSEPSPDYTDKTINFDVKEFFSCPVTGSGVFFDYTDKADRHFNVTFTLTPKVKGEKYLLQEDFKWSDGEEQQRIWTLNFTDTNTFTGTADDIVGTAHGKSNHNGLHMMYTIKAKRKNGDIVELNMDDRLYMTDPYTIINRAKAKKYGIQVGELVASFSQNPSCRSLITEFDLKIMKPE